MDGESDVEASLQPSSYYTHSRWFPKYNNLQRNPQTQLRPPQLCINRKCIHASLTIAAMFSQFNLSCTTLKCVTELAFAKQFGPNCRESGVDVQTVHF